MLASHNTQMSVSALAHNRGRDIVFIVQYEVIHYLKPPCIRFMIVFRYIYLLTPHVFNRTNLIYIGLYTYLHTCTYIDG